MELNECTRRLVDDWLMEWLIDWLIDWCYYSTMSLISDNIGYYRLSWFYTSWITSDLHSALVINSSMQFVLIYAYHYWAIVLRISLKSLDYHCNYSSSLWINLKIIWKMKSKFLYQPSSYVWLIVRIVLMIINWKSWKYFMQFVEIRNFWLRYSLISIVILNLLIFSQEWWLGFLRLQRLVIQWEIYIYIC